MGNPAQAAQKKAAAVAALDYIEPGMVLGVGSGSTVHYFIEALSAVRGQIEAAVVSSVESEKRIKALSIPVWDLNSVGEVPLYVDGADEIDASHRMMKGGGGALTREKILASNAKKFVCIVDQSKQVNRLGAFPLAIEVIPMARSAVARQMVMLGGQPVWREGVVTDNGNVLLDVYHLKIDVPTQLEEKINNIPGVVAHGLFARRTADVVLVGTDQGVIRC